MRLHDEELKARYVACTIWTILINQGVLLSLLLLTNISFSLPWTWLAESLYQIFSLKFIFTTGIFLICIPYLIYIFAKVLKVSDVIYEKRYQIFEKHFQLKTVSFGLTCGAIGLAVSICLSKLLFCEAYSNLLVADQEDGQRAIFNERLYCLAWIGFASGLVFASKMYICNKNTVLFLDSQESLLDNIFRNAFHLGPQSLRTSFHQLIGFIPLYCLMRNTKILFAYAILAEPGSESFFFQIFNPYMLVDLLIIGTYIHFTWSMGLALLKMYSTRCLPLPLTSLLNPEDSVQGHLKDLSPPNLLKYLVYNRMKELSCSSSPARKEIFALSELGGHPHLWNLISSRCLSQLQNLLQEIKTTNAFLLNKGDIPRTIALQRSALPENLRIRLHLADLSPMAKKDNKAANASKPFTKMVLEWMLSLAPVRFLGAPLPLATTTRLFASCQPTIWCVHALGALLCTSFEEDEFGVVQRDLPQLISALAELNEAVEKHLKLIGVFGGGTSVSLSPFLDTLYSNTVLPWRLREALNQSLRAVLTTFGKHIDSIELSTQVKQILDPYRDTSVSTF